MDLLLAFSGFAKSPWPILMSSRGRQLGWSVHRLIIDRISLSPERRAWLGSFYRDAFLEAGWALRRLPTLHRLGIDAAALHYLSGADQGEPTLSTLCSVLREPEPSSCFMSAVVRIQAECGRLGRPGNAGVVMAVSHGLASLAPRSGRTARHSHSLTVRH